MGNEYLVEGAILMCVNGGLFSALKIPAGHGYTSDGKKKANCMDCKACINISDFGSCKKNKKDRLCAGFMELERKWENTSITLNKPENVDGEEAITMDSVLICKKGGIIMPLTSGQGFAPGLDYAAFIKRYLNVILWAAGKNQLCHVFGGDPVNVNTGNFIYEKKDLVITGITELSFHLFYNAMEDGRGGSMGNGWHHNFEMFLKIENGGRKIFVCMGDGREIPFQHTIGEIYVSVLGDRSLLKREKNGYLFFLTNGHEYFFGMQGILLTRKDRNGNTDFLVYNSQGQLEKIVGANGGELKYYYNKERKLIRVQDHTGRTVQLWYQYGKLWRFINALGNEYIYTYNEHEKLETIKTPRGIIGLKNSYDAADRVVKQKMPDGGIIELKYDDNNKVTYMKERNGKLVTYKSDDRFRNVETVYRDGKEIFAYSDRNQPVLYVDKNGNKTRYQYDKDGNLVQLFNALEEMAEFVYAKCGKLLTAAIQGIVVQRNTYDSKGHLVKVTDALHRSRDILYDVKGRPCRLVQPDASQIEISYDSKGNIECVTDAHGGITVYTYDSLNRVIKSSDAEGNEYLFQYDEMDRVVSIINPLGNQKAYVYNKSGKPVKIIDYDGKAVCFEYDNMNRPVKITDKEGRITLRKYDHLGNLTEEQSPSGAVISYHYNDRFQLEKAEVRDEKKIVTVITYKYDSVGNMVFTGVGDDREIKSSFSFECDALNRIKVKTDPAGGKTTFDYDCHGNLISVTDPVGNRKNFLYNDAGELVRETDESGNTYCYTYDVLGNVTAVTDGRGQTIKYIRKSGGRLEKIIYPEGQEETFTYDRIGRIKTKANSLGYCLTYYYDKLGRVLKIASNLGQERSWRYDKSGNVISATDANGNVTSYEYSPGGQLTLVKDSMGNSTRYGYDPGDRLIWICQSGNNEKERRETWYNRNVLGQVESITDALGEREYFVYDALGRIMKKTDKEGTCTKYSYTADSRIESIMYEDGNMVELEYTPLGMLARVKDWLGEMQFERNKQGMPVSVTDYKGRKVRYEWGKFGEKTKITYPDEKNISYFYDKMLRLKETVKTESGKEDIKITYQYDEGGRLAQKQMPGGIKTIWKYDIQGQLKELIHVNGEEIFERYRYQYDAVGNKINVEKERCGLPNECGKYTYGYDRLNRLVSVEKDGKKLRKYTYDSFGNRIQMEDFIGGITINSVSNSMNQLMKEEVLAKDSAAVSELRTYIYDKRGNQTAEYRNGILTHKYAYNAMNSLVYTGNGNRIAAEYIYNGLGQRVGKNNEEYVLDQTKSERNLLEIIEGKRKKDFYWDADIAFMEQAERPPQYYIVDELGSPVRILYTTGKGQCYSYDEFGNILPETNGYLSAGQNCGPGEDQPFGYTGYICDQDSDTYFAQAREYKPGQGRFMSMDQDKFINVGDPLTVNLYSYCRNAPLNYVDISGNEVIIVSGGNDDYNKDEVNHYQYMFVEPALKKVNDEIASGTPKEDITWMVVDAGYSGSQLNNFKKTADNLGVNFVNVSNKKEFTSYINSKNGGTTRNTDKVTEMAIFSHGISYKYGGKVENQLAFAYHVNNVKQEDINFMQSDIASLDRNAFDKTLTTFYSCNAGTEDNNGDSFAQIWSNKTGGASYGIKNGRTLYTVINMAGNWGFHAGEFTFLPGEVWNKIMNTEAWQEKQKRKADRALKGYSDLGSLNYPCLVSWAGDLDVLFSDGVFDRGWREFKPECGTE